MNYVSGLPKVLVLLTFYRTFSWVKDIFCISPNLPIFLGITIIFLSAFFQAFITVILFPSIVLNFLPPSLFSFLSFFLDFFLSIFLSFLLSSIILSFYIILSFFCLSFSLSIILSFFFASPAIQYPGTHSHTLVLGFPIPLEKQQSILRVIQ